MLPDQHLGRNTAYKMGVPLDQMVVWDPHEICGGLTPEQVEGREADPVEGPLLRPHALHRRADRRVPEEVSRRPGRSRIPECTFDVVQAADESGSTEYIINAVKDSPDGIGVGGRDRDPSRQPARARGRARPDRRDARSVRLPVLDDVPRVAEPPAVDARRAASKGRSTTRSSSPTSRSAGAKLALDRMLAGLRRPLTRALDDFITEKEYSMAHSVPPLPYDYNALEPHIDEQTMRIHHDKHHAAYVNNLNAALEKHPELQQRASRI